MQVTAMNNETIDASLKLPEILDLAAAEGLLEALRQQVHGDRSLCIDASDVETLTLPCMQIILAAKTYHGGVSMKNSVGCLYLGGRGSRYSFGVHYG